ncbi:MFS transporter [Sphingobium sp. CAP-1]|uniref:MFS transporter n=1 Tax=Sphingobium sp. CAP-1 TaxID=2676077 RepID=UPI0012BB285E|nr:MFS transporter [Sphingobium sp. CAP-1]QGP80969.1 MFS transporter [Sphingobium sp. CAP-1]
MRKAAKSSSRTKAPRAIENAIDAAAILSNRQRSMALAIVAAAMVLDLIDMTIINVAVPTLQGKFGASDAEVQWMVAGYSTIFSLLLITGGRLGDIYGYRLAFLYGVAGFTVTSLLCGLAQTPDQLIVARLFQGGAAAIMLPQVMSLTQIMYAPHERMAALGLFGILGGLAAVLGPVIGGALISADLFGLSWRPIFLINLPIGLVAVFCAHRVLPRGRSKRQPRLDMVGTFLVMVLLFSLIFPLIQGRGDGWPIWGFVLMALSIPLCLLLAWYSRVRMRRDGSPLIVPDLFSARAFSTGLVTTLLFQVATGGLLFTLALALQRGLGFSPAEVGLTHIPYAFGASFAIGMLSRKALPRFGPVIISWGALLMGAGLGLLLLLLNRTNLVIAHPWLLAPPLLAMGLGMGLAGGPLPPCTLSEVDVGHAGSASGLLKATQQLGSAIGIAAIGSLFFAIQPNADANGAMAIKAFTISAAFIGLALLSVGLAAFAIPRTLRIRGDADTTRLAVTDAATPGRTEIAT